MMGRELIMPEDMVNSIITNVENGVTFEDAARLAGISESTIYNWKRKGKDGDRPEYVAFYQRLIQAETKAKVNKIQICEAGAKDDPRLALELLARKYPEEWGRKEKILVTNKLEEFIAAFRAADNIDDTESETKTDTEL